MPIINIKDDIHWKELRQQHVGASESAALFINPEDAVEGVHSYKSYYELWQEKSGHLAPLELDEEIIMAGQILEPGIAELLEWKLSKTLDKDIKVEKFEGYVSHDTIKGMGCTPDYVVHGYFDEPAIVEIKNTSWLQFKRAWENEEPPLNYIIQLQHQLACMKHLGFKYGMVAACIGGNRIDHFDFEFNADIAAAIEKRVTQFWESVEKGIAPDPDGSPATSKALKRMFTESDSEKSLDFSDCGDFQHRLHELTQARLDKKAAEEKERAATNWLLHNIKDAEIANINEEPALIAKTIKRKGYTVDPSTYRTLKVI